MKYNQKALELHPQQSRLIDSLCFELAVNIPDQNSLSLLEILEMRRNSQINEQELKQLYVDWLQSKNIFDIFVAKQVRIYPKSQLIAKESLERHIQIDAILSTLQLLNTLYNEMYLKKKGNDAALKNLHQVEDLFQFLDANGKIHLGLSELFFLALALSIIEGHSIPVTYDQFKPFFKKKNKQLCQVQGMVCLRCFKNFFLAPGNGYAKQALDILKQMSKSLRKGQNKNRQEINLPDILAQSFTRWRNSSRFHGLLESKKKRFEIYHRIFTQNAEIFFFNGRDENNLSETWFYKKYSEDYIRSLQIQSGVLREFAQIVNVILNETLSAISKMNGLNAKMKILSATNSNITHQTTSLNFQQTSSALKTLNQNQKKIRNTTYQASSNKMLGSKIQNNSSFKEKTPTKSNNKGNQTRRFNITPTHRNNGLSPFISKQFASTEKSAQKSKGHLTPSKSSYSGYSLYMPQQTQVYRNSKKQGLEKDSFYEKLFFFRNKRVQSFDIVMKRLKGK